MKAQLLTGLTPAPIRQAANPAAVAEAFKQAVPGFASGAHVLDELGLSWRLRKEEDLWRGTLRVTWRETADSEPQLTRVLAQLTLDETPVVTPSDATVPFGTAGWSGHLADLGIAMSCEADVDLPTLPGLLEPEQALTFLTPMLKEARADLPEIEGCTPSILRYKHGSRCTVGYQLTPDSPELLPINPVVAKTYAGRKGEIAHEAMQAMWDSELRHSENVAIAEPLGYDPERSLLLQGPVRGDTTLKAVTLAWFANGEGSLDQLEGLIRSTARGLADLHLSAALVGEQRVWQTDLEELTSRRDRVTDAMPGVGSYASELIVALEALDQSSGPLPLVPTHGSFRTAQVLVDGDDVAFIDFDSFAQAEPALDVAEFAFRLEQLALVKVLPDMNDGRSDPVQRGLDVDRLTNAFLEEYRSKAPVDQDRIALWWTVGALSLVFSSFIKLKLARVPACVALVDRATARFDLPAT